jgi:hypothetical protein
MNKKFIIILGVVFTAAKIIGVFINPSLVSSPKSNESNLTLERIEAYTGEGEAGGGGPPNCNQHDETNPNWNRTVRVNGIDILAKKREIHYCTAGGRKRKCITGAKYWNYNNDVILNTIDTIDCAY